MTPLLTTREAAAVIGVSAGRVSALVRAGRLERQELRLVAGRWCSLFALEAVEACRDDPLRRRGRRKSARRRDREALARVAEMVPQGVSPFRKSRCIPS